jgi:hypothetical protein
MDVTQKIRQKCLRWPPVKTPYDPAPGKILNPKIFAPEVAMASSQSAFQKALHGLLRQVHDSNGASA